MAEPGEPGKLSPVVYVNDGNGNLVPRSENEAQMHPRGRDLTPRQAQRRDDLVQFKEDAQDIVLELAKAELARLRQSGDRVMQDGDRMCQISCLHDLIFGNAHVAVKARRQYVELLELRRKRMEWRRDQTEKLKGGRALIQKRMLKRDEALY